MPNGGFEMSLRLQNREPVHLLDERAAPVASSSRKSAVIAFDLTPGITESIHLMRSSLINCLGLLVSGCAGIILIPIMLTTLRADQYGLWVATLAVTNIVGALDFGLGSSITREVAASINDEMREETSRFIQTASNVYLLLAVAGALIIFALGVPLSAGLKFSSETREIANVVFILSGITFFAEQLILFTTAALGGLRRFTIINGVSIVMVLLRTIGFILLLRAGANLIVVMIWQVVVSMITAVVALNVVARIEPRYRLRLGRLDWGALRAHMRFSLESLLTTLMNSVIWQVPTILIGCLHTAEAIALYNIAQKFPLLVSSFASRISIVFYPAASQHERSRDIISTRELVKMGTRWIVVSVLPTCIFLWIMAPYLLQTWLGEARADTLLVFRLSNAAVLANAAGAVTMQVLWGRGAVRQVLFISAGVVIVDLVLTFWFLRLFGIAGAAYALLISVTLGTAAFISFTLHECGMLITQLFRAVSAGLLFPSTACLTVALGFVYLVKPGGWMRIVAAAASSGIVYALSFYLKGAREEERMIIKNAFGWSIRMTRLVSPKWRTAASRFHFLRSGWYLILTLIATVRYTLEGNCTKATDEYERRVDPWGYATDWGETHLRLTEEFLDSVHSHECFYSTLEIGCGEGIVTELLAPRCRSVMAVDISRTALERASKRCQVWEHLHFAEWDLLCDAAPGAYDLVLVMGVLECFRRPSDLRKAKRKILEMLTPGGYLLVTTTKQHPVIEGAWWARYFVQGSLGINAFLLKHGHLSLCRMSSTETHLFTLYRRS